MTGWRRRARRAAARPLDAVFGVVVGVDVTRPAVALTFDDGPDPDTTPEVLAVLERHGARGTFFMVGRAAQRAPELVERMALAGHAIGHHTLDHVSLPGLGAHDRVEQVTAGFEAIGPRCTRLFRPPFGHLDPATWWTVRRRRHDIVAWSGHAFDWEPQDVATLAARIRHQLVPGAIVLLHDAPQRGDAQDAAPRSALVAALDAVLRDVGRSFEFVTVPELLASGRARRRARWRAAPEDGGVASAATEPPGL
jgi:peptidoglycan/xylan/chitin deacetylase (PgdA/CDA1 family)